MNILVVDDNLNSRELIRSHLHSAGFNVYEASDGQEATGILTSHSIQAVIAEVLMPRMGGYRLCAEMRRQPCYDDVAVIICTDRFTSSDDRDVALDLGADAFLIKSSPLPELLNCLRSAFDGLSQRKERQRSLGWPGSRGHVVPTTTEPSPHMDSAGELEMISRAISHDLKTPLRHIKSNVEMLTGGNSQSSGLTDRAREYVKDIGNVCDEMTLRIEGLLKFSRLGRVEKLESRVSLEDLVQNAIQILTAAARGRDIRWMVNPLPDVIGDPLLLGQVFHHLMENAVKFSRVREHAEIEIGCAGYEEGRLIVFVRDNGIGFDMRYSDKLFGVFRRLHRMEEFEGAGVGLACVKRIIGRHGGRVWVESEPDRGTTFFFTVEVMPAA